MFIIFYKKWFKICLISLCNILQAINKEIDSAIENALQDIANESGINTTKLLKNYKDINKEYADYAKFKESDFYKDTIKSKKREKDLSDENFNYAILKQAKRQDGFNNKVFNRIANNTDTNLQAQAIKELIQRNIANGNGQFRAVKWQELIQDLEKIEHSITDSGLKSLVSNLKQAQRLYNGDNEFLQAVQRSVGSKPANVLISSASGLFGRTLLLFYNFVHKSMSRFAGALSEKLAHQSLEDQLGKALRYARDTKDFIHVSIDSISKNLPKEDKETSKVLKELEYWKNQFDKDDIASFYTIKDAHNTQEAIKSHQAELMEYKAVINHAIQTTQQDMQGLHNGVVDSIKGLKPTANKNLAVGNQAREIPQNLQEAWLKEFNLKSIQEDFIPQFNDEIRQALDKAGITQDFHLKLGSLLKLDNKQREAFLPYIKPTIEHPNLILDNGKGILFIKEFVDSDKNRYFMSVAKDFNDEWIFSSHTRRELNNINNELQKSKVIYNNGFKGGEVAGASDILESGGTTTKPSDLQITYPANHSSGKNPNPNATTIKQTKQDMQKEIPYNTQVEFDRQGMAEFQRKIESGEIQLDKPTQKTLENAYAQYNHCIESKGREYTINSQICIGVKNCPSSCFIPFCKNSSKRLPKN